MHTYSVTLPGQGEINYQDTRRYGWMIATFFPLVPLLSIGLVMLSGREWTLWIPLLLIYTLVPLLDFWLGEDERNPPEQIVPQLEDDRYYRYLTFAAVPMFFITLITVAWFVGTHDVGWSGFAALVITTGVVNGMAINTGHELGHKKPRLEKNLAKMVLAVPVYPHFNVEHNAGHHVQVATPEDSASSRFGESIYRFARREIPGGIRRGWQLEKRRLAQLGRKPWSISNNILQSLAMSVALYGLLAGFFGWFALAFLLLQAPIAWFQLTGANYVEHYGLLREKLPDGRYETCQPRHSWNANHVASNILLFHLQRHSDHHYHASRRYQSLRHFDDAPQLPSGYVGMLLLADVPILWHKVIDPKTLALVDGDLSKLNVDPSILD